MEQDFAIWYSSFLESWCIGRYSCIGTESCLFIRHIPLGEFFWPHECSKTVWKFKDKDGKVLEAMNEELKIEIGDGNDDEEDVLSKKKKQNSMKKSRSSITFDQKI